MYYILIFITTYNLYHAFMYMYQLEKDMKKGKYVMNDEYHSLQHIAITGITTTISVAMLFWDPSGFEILVHVIYNASLTFIIYPHLKSE